MAHLTYTDESSVVLRGEKDKFILAGVSPLKPYGPFRCSQGQRHVRDQPGTASGSVAQNEAQIVQGEQYGCRTLFGCLPDRDVRLPLLGLD